MLARTGAMLKHIAVTSDIVLRTSARYAADAAGMPVRAARMLVAPAARKSQTAAPVIAAIPFDNDSFEAFVVNDVKATIHSALGSLQLDVVQKMSAASKNPTAKSSSSTGINMSASFLTDVVSVVTGFSWIKTSEMQPPKANTLPTLTESTAVPTAPAGLSFLVNDSSLSESGDIMDGVRRVSRLSSFGSQLQVSRSAVLPLATAALSYATSATIPIINSSSSGGSLQSYAIEIDDDEEEEEDVVVVSEEAVEGVLWP